MRKIFKERKTILHLLFLFFVLVLGGLFIFLLNSPKAFSQTQDNSANFNAFPVSACAIKLTWESNSSSTIFELKKNIEEGVGTEVGFAIEPQVAGTISIIDNGISGELAGAKMYSTTKESEYLVGNRYIDDSGFPGLNPGTTMKYTLSKRELNMDDFSEIGSQSATTFNFNISADQIKLQEKVIVEKNGSSANFSVPIPDTLLQSQKDKTLYGILAKKEGGNLQRFVAENHYSSGNIEFSLDATPTASSNDVSYDIQYYYTDYFCHPFSDNNTQKDLTNSQVTINNVKQIVVSDVQKVTIPATPINASATTTNMTYDGKIVVTVSWERDPKSNSANVDYFEIYRKEKESDYKRIAVVPDRDSNSSFKYEDKVLANTNYTYSIRGCNKWACSDSIQANVSTPSAIGFFNPRVQYIDIKNSTATILITAAKSGNFKVTLQRSDDIGNTKELGDDAVCLGGAGLTCFIDYIPLGHQYTYSISGIRSDGGEVRIFGPNSIEIDLREISPIHGWAWAGPTSTPEAVNYSVGWIKFSSDTTSTDPSSITVGSQKYGVYLNRKTGELMGYAWSGIPCSSDSTKNCGYGWVSFNKGDLDTGYAPASINSNGNLSGYVKFVSFDPTESSFDGYVNLAGVNYDKDKGILTGNTSEVAVVPKIHFCDPNNGDNPAYCVYVSPEVYPAGKPKIEVNPQPCEGSGTNVNCPVNIKINNPKTYSEVRVKVFSGEDSEYNTCKNLTLDSAEADRENCWIDLITSSDKPELKDEGTHEFSTKDLQDFKFNASTTYKFIIRAVIQ